MFKLNYMYFCFQLLMYNTIAYKSQTLKNKGSKSFGQKSKTLQRARRNPTFPELEKAGSTDSAKPDFFQIYQQICPSYHQIFTKSYQILPKF